MNPWRPCDLNGFRVRRYPSGAIRPNPGTPTLSCANGVLHRSPSDLVRAHPAPVGRSFGRSAVATYRAKFEQLAKAAVSGDQASMLLSRAAKDLREQRL